MKKSTISILLSAMMTISGIAAAQTAPMKSGTDGGSGPSAAEKAARSPTDKSRAAVKSESAPMKAGVDGGEGPVPNSAKTTAAERRAVAANAPKRPKVSGSDVQKDGKSGGVQ